MTSMTETARSSAPLVSRPRLEEASDEELVGQIGQGSEDALAEVYRRHAGHVFALANDAAGGIHLAGAVVQAVFVTLWDEPARFGPGRASLRASLLTSARRFAEPGQCATAIGSLPDDEQEVVELACFQGRSCSEIAELLDLGEGTVSSRIRRGLKRVAQNMSAA